MKARKDLGGQGSVAGNYTIVHFTNQESKLSVICK